MRVALLHTFAASKKEPLAAMMDRIHQAFLDVGLGEPAVRFNFADSPLPGGVSAVDRVLKRCPELGRFAGSTPPVAGMPGARNITNAPASGGSGESVPYSTLQTVAAGIPKSFPFHSVTIHFHTPEFGELAPVAFPGQALAGVLLGDSWWINGRVRSLSACTVVEADPASKELPPPSPAVAEVLAACGKIKSTVQAPLIEVSPSGRLTMSLQGAAAAMGVRPPGGGVRADAIPEAARVVQDIVAGYRARMREVVERAALPHALPAAQEALRTTPLGIASGPKKPALERAFKPMGYSCKGDSGTFTLRRRTSANLTLELFLDVGSWSNSLTAMFHVMGVSFRATLTLPVSANALTLRQYPIGGAGRWEKIVENLAALVTELERSLVPEIERAAGPSPEWYQPEN